MGTFVATQSRLMDDVLSSILGQLHEHYLDRVGGPGHDGPPAHAEQDHGLVVPALPHTALPTSIRSSWQRFYAATTSRPTWFSVATISSCGCCRRSRDGQAPFYPPQVRLRPGVQVRDAPRTCRSSSRSGSTSSGTSKAAAAAPVNSARPSSACSRTSPTPSPTSTMPT